MYILNLALEASTPYHNVYVIELSRDVLHEDKFRKLNPHAKPNSICVYVGSTGLSPEERFKKHKLGIKHNAYVYKYGTRLLVDLYKQYNPMTYDDAIKKEFELAHLLRAKGYAVYQA